MILAYDLHAVIMTSRSGQKENEILSFLYQEDENDGNLPLESDSEVDDHLSEDNVHSDFEDTFIENEPEEESHHSSDGEDLSPAVSVKTVCGEHKNDVCLACL